MKQGCLVAFLGLSSAAFAPAQGSPEFLYSIDANNIAAFRIDANQGTLTPVPGSPYGIPAVPTSAAVDPSGHFLYVAQKNETVAEFQIEPASGALTAVPGSPFPVAGGPSAVAVDGTGHFVFVSETNGIATFTLDANLGALTPSEPPAQHTGGEMLAHPTAPFLFSRVGRLRVYRINQYAGALKRLRGTGSKLTTFALSPSGAIAYTRASGEIHAYAFDNTGGDLTEIAGSPFKVGGNGKITIDPTGRFLYTLDGPSKLSAFVLDAATGSLLARVPGSPFAAAGGQDSISADPSGKFLYTGDGRLGTVSAFTINGSTGALAPIAGSPFSTGNPVLDVLTVSPSMATPPSLTGLEVRPSDVSIHSNTFGKNRQFTAVGQYSDGSTGFLTASATWSSSDTFVATMANTADYAGLARTVGAGMATITATVGKLTATATLTVSQPALVSIAVTPANPTIDAGTTLPFKATGTYNDGATRNVTNTAAWVSSSPSVAAINASGQAMALAPGSTNLSATVGSVVGSTVLTVE